MSESLSTFFNDVKQNENGLEFIFLVTDLTVHMTLNLDKLRIYVVGKAAGVLDEFCKVFSLNHLIPHRTLYAAFNGNYLLGDRNKEDVVVLNVEPARESWMLRMEP